MKKLSSACEDSVDWVRDQDAVVLPFCEYLHGGDDIKQSTVIGGSFSLLVKCYVYYIMVVQAITMFKRDGPTIVSQEITYSDDD